MEQRKKRSRREWLEVVRKQEESGLSARAFCQDRGLGLASFYQWRRRLRNERFESTGNNESMGKIGFTGETKSKGVFIDMGQVASSGVGARTGGSRWVVTLDLGEGLQLTLRRD